jgi:hypothetical protein
LGWWLYVVVGWFALVVFFWCLLVVAARADRRDASARPQEVPERGQPEPADTRRFAHTRRLLDRHSVADGSRARDEPDQELLHHRRRRR